jgi:hypothetical protein
MFAKKRFVTLSIPVAILPKSHPSPLVRPERSAVEGSAVFAKKRFVTLSIPVAILPKSNPSPLVIPTGAPEERSGGICSAPCGSLKSILGSVPDEPQWSARKPHYIDAQLTTLIA